MLRRLLPAVVCAALLVTGCGKREEGAPAPVRVARNAARAPAGMVSLPGDRPAFVSTKALTVGQYLEYLAGTGQGVPAQWQSVQADSPEAGRPVVGLSRADAGHCAVWHLKRLPTAEEWARAAEVVQPRPYPWNEDGSPVAPSAEVFLVQGYASRTPEEGAALRDKEGLAEAILKEYLAESTRLAEDVRDQVAAEQTRRQLAWQEAKPAFFALLEKERGLAQEKETRAGHMDVLGEVDQLVKAKTHLAVGLVAGDLTTEQKDAAIAEYGRLLASKRAEAQKARELLQKGLEAAQKEVVDLSKAYEERGAARVDGGLADVLKMIADASGPPETIAQAAAAKARLEAAAGRLKEALAAGSLPTLGDLTQRATQVDAALSRLPADDTPAKTAQLRTTLKEIGEAIKHKSLQEDELLTALDELAELRARKRAAEAGVTFLKAALPQAAAGSGPAAP